MSDASLERALVLKGEILAIDRRSQERQQSDLGRKATRLQGAIFEQNVRHQKIKAGLNTLPLPMGHQGLLVEAQRAHFRMNCLRKSKTALNKATNELLVTKASSKKMGEQIAAIQTKSDFISNLHQKIILKRRAQIEEHRAESIIEDRAGVGNGRLFEQKEIESDNSSPEILAAMLNDREADDGSLGAVGLASDAFFSADAANNQSITNYQTPVNFGGGAFEGRHSPTDYHSNSQLNQSSSKTATTVGQEPHLSERIQAFVAFQGLAGEGVSFTYHGRSGDEVSVQLAVARDGLLRLVLSPSSERSRRELQAERGELLKSLKAAGVQVGDVRLIRGV